MGNSFRFLWLALTGVALFYLFSGDREEAKTAQQFETPRMVEPAQRAAAQMCDIWTDHIRAQFSSRGATLQSYELLTAKYSGGQHTNNLTTTPNPSPDPGDSAAMGPEHRGEYHEYRQQLFLHWRNPTVNPPGGVEWNVAYDSVDYRIVGSDGKSCRFVYEDDKVQLTKLVAATERPFELALTATIKNLSTKPLAHALAIDTIDWRRNEEVKGSMFRVSPYVSHVECENTGDKATRLGPDDFEPSDSADAGHLPRWGWYEDPSPAEYAAVSNAYFANAVAAVGGREAKCQVMIENRGGTTHPLAGAYYRARLAYPVVTLAPAQSEEYSALAYIGPKERKVLAAAGGGEHGLSNLIDLGFFAAIAKVLVGFLLAVHGVIPNWGIAIIVLTVTARVLLFPLSVPGIKNMIAMRALKPDLDALNAKYKDDAQAKGLAQMELYKQKGVNPLKGCLPQLASMPVWFALYTTLQTAVELYNIPFLWFPDLTESDPLYILPFVIGGTYFIQQKMMPMQADPAQQKMMMYMMPGMFTVFMLFLPAGLGVYMFTNSVLAIFQQQVVEWHVARTTGIRRNDDKGAIKVTAKDEASSKSKAKQKATKGKDDPQKRERSLLDKGKA